MKFYESISVFISATGAKYSVEFETRKRNKKITNEFKKKKKEQPSCASCRANENAMNLSIQVERWKRQTTTTTKILKWEKN